LNTSHQEVFICFYLQVNSNMYKTGINYLLHSTAKKKYAKGVAFAVGYDYWSAIHVDDDYYYTSLSCVSERVNDRSILFYFCFPTYGMAFPMYSGSIMCFHPHIPHGTTDPTKKGVRIFSAYVSARTCNTHHEFMHT
jgi:hypothetical protein